MFVSLENLSIHFLVADLNPKKKKKKKKKRKYRPSLLLHQLENPTMSLDAYQYPLRKPEPHRWSRRHCSSKSDSDSISDPNESAFIFVEISDFSATMRMTSFVWTLRWSKEWASMETWSLSWRKVRISPKSALMRARLCGEEEEFWKKKEVRERLGLVGRWIGGHGMCRLGFWGWRWLLCCYGCLGNEKRIVCFLGKGNGRFFIFYYNFFWGNNFFFMGIIVNSSFIFLLMVFDEMRMLIK